MARQPRFDLVGHPQHIISRGNNNNAVFYEDEDYEYYLDKLKLAIVKHDCEVHAYVLMPNQIQLLLTPNKSDGISKTMQMIGRYYVQYFNHKYKRTGTLWDGRYKATLVDGAHFGLFCYRYIELNPARSRERVKNPKEYRWSSYKHNALNINDGLVMPHKSYKRLGRTKAERALNYRHLFNTEIPKQTLEKICTPSNNTWALGSPEFLSNMEKKLNRPVLPKSRGGDRRSKAFRERAETRKQLAG